MHMLLTFAYWGVKEQIGRIVYVQSLLTTTVDRLDIGNGLKGCTLFSRAFCIVSILF